MSNSISRAIFKFLFLVCCGSFCTAAADDVCVRPIAESDSISVALLGDSMTWIGGDSCQKKTGWSYWLKQQFPSWSIKPFARSGATWTNTAATRGDMQHYSEVLDDENVIFNQVLRLIKYAGEDSAFSPDIIVIYAGTNDAWFQKRRPDLFSSMELPEGSVAHCVPSQYTSLASSIELSCRLLRENFPDAKILLVTPAPFSKVGHDTLTKISDIIETAARGLSLPVFRADREIHFDTALEASPKRKFTTDGVHTSPAGAQYIARAVSDFIRASVFSPHPNTSSKILKSTE